MDAAAAAATTAGAGVVENPPNLGPEGGCPAGLKFEPTKAPVDGAENNPELPGASIGAVGGGAEDRFDASLSAGAAGADVGDVKEFDAIGAGLASRWGATAAGAAAD